MHNRNTKPFLLVIFFVLSILPCTGACTDNLLSDKEISVTAHDGTELSMYHYTAEGEYLVIWVASSYSMHDRIYSMFQSLGKQGIEVWQIDFADTLFQPRTSNLMRNIDARYISDLVEAAHRQTKKKIILMARAYGAIPVLRGATLWHKKNPEKNYLSGVVLFSPDLYEAIPELGLDPEYVSVTRATSVPIMIYQAQSRGTSWQLPRLLKTLHTNNTSIYYTVMTGVSGLFYHNDTSPSTLKKLQQLPVELPGIFRLLDKTEKSKPAAQYSLVKKPAASRMNTRLNPFKGNPDARTIRLHDINGKLVTLSDYKNQVTVVNFWATWCPPCVHEIPSLNRLRAKMQGKRFRLISVNYAESPEAVRDFLNRVNVEFPVLMDINSKASAQWNVIAFPSTFVIGADGKIHYGVNAAIEWDSPEVIRILESLQ